MPDLTGIGTAAGSGYVLGQVVKAGKDLGLAAMGPWLERRRNVEAADSVVRNADARRQERLIDARTSQDLKAVRSGRAKIDGQNQLVYLSSDHQAPLTSASGDGAGEIMGLARLSQDLDSAERLLTLREIVRLAEEEAEKLNRKSRSERPIEPSWLRQYREAASDSPDDDSMRLLWAKLLLAEADDAGSQSLRTLNTLSLMSSQEAKIFSRLCPLVINGGVFLLQDAPLYLQGGPVDPVPPEGFSNATFLTDRDLDYVALKLLEHAGLVSIDTFTSADIPEHEYGGDRFWQIGFLEKLMMYVVNPKHQAALRFPVGSLTQAGVAILRLGNFEPDRAYIEVIANYLKHYQPDEIALCHVQLENGSVVSRGPAEKLFP